MSNISKQASAKALEIRRESGISPVAPIEIWKLLQDFKISLIKEPLESEISGMFLRKDTAEVIVINTKNTLGHQNFTAAHEYFHLKYHPELTARACNAGQFNSKNILEHEADYFAAYLLAPNEAINYYLGKRFNWTHRKLSLSHIIAAEQHFSMSHHAMLIRLVQTGWINEQESNQFKENIIRNARELGYDTGLYRPTLEKKVISDYAEKAKIALDHGLITAGKYDELLLEAGLGDLLFINEEEDAEVFF